MTEDRFHEIRADLLVAVGHTGADREAALRSLTDRYGHADVLAAAEVMHALATIAGAIGRR
ncbi:hypothetical protein ACTWP5_27715 [Streptomyces sp. 4N509B]|uniref:hypothetical protein n=1 Tax=Streptomyces sp. 4N509B TaxID=3457413 RepID=UPI003FD549B1